MRSVIRILLVVAPCAFVTGCGDEDPAGGPPPAPPSAEDAATAGDAGAPPRDAATPPPAHDAEPAPDLGPPTEPELDSCWGDRWCWVEGAPALALDGASLDTVYSADDGGRLWHWNGSGWDSVAGLENRRVRRVYVAAADDLWVVAEHVDEGGYFVDRFDGATWTTVRGNVDPRFLSGFGSDNVWVRERDTLAWVRFDGRAWWSVERPDPARYEVIYDGLNEKLMPGPAPEAYAITVTRIDPSVPPPHPHEVTVMHFDGSTWAPMGTLSTGWSELAWVSGEPHVIEHSDDGSAELRFDGARWARAQWVPADSATEGHWLSGSDRGVATVPHGRSCIDVLPVGNEIFCTTLAYGGGEGRTVARSDSHENWTDTVFPIATRPMSPEYWDDVAPGYWAGGARRSWGDGPDNVLRVHGAGADSWRASMLERVQRGAATAVLDENGQPVVATQIDGVTGEDAWVAAGGIYRVSGLRAERVTMPEDFAWAQVHAIAAESADRAWALATDSERSLVLRIEGDVVWIDEEMPLTMLVGDRDERVALHDIAVDSVGDLWVLGTVGARSGHGILFHRGPGGRCGPAWTTVRLWDEAFSARQVVYYRDALYISGVNGVWNTLVGGWIGGMSVVRVPLASLGGESITQPPSDFALGRAPSILADGQIFATDGDFAFDWSDPELWVGESGVWLTTEDAARRFVEIR